MSSWEESPAPPPPAGDPDGRTDAGGGSADDDREDGAVVVLPTREDELARAAAPVAGGPAGRRVRTSRHPLRAALAGGSALGLLVLAGAVLLRQHCRETLWAAPGLYTHACYSDVPLVFRGAYLDEVVPYFERYERADFLDAPFGVGWLLWGLGRLAGVAPGEETAGRDVFDASVVLAAVALVVAVAGVVHLSARRPSDALLLAGSPVVLVCALVGVQLVPVALAVAGLWASARGRAVVGGLLLGLAALVAPLAGLVVVGALLLVRWRRRRDDAVARAERPEPSAAAGPGDDLESQEQERPVLDAELRTAAAAALVWFAGGFPVLLDNVGVWLDAVTARVVAGAGYGSVWFLGDLLGVPPADGTTTAASLVLRVVGVLGVVALVLRAPRPPRVPVVALLLLVVALVTAPALPPQAAVLVLPLAVLALPHWRLLLVWGAVEAAAATGTWLYLYGLAVPDRGLPPWAYALLVVARLGALLVLAGRAVEVSLHPERDAVRSPRSAPSLGVDDPALPPARRGSPEDEPGPAPAPTTGSGPVLRPATAPGPPPAGTAR
ncbi:hypothetical protein [uncultured Pseudokineococcus sp.]|uniref:hypothetical protein n=1 Tax=uncultured Pseudokineococcus sp. TaxID=1642928 RepID=UPI00261E64C6|nr:hypothetical protein [uncultured Pseudokineococcus sp.]